MKKLIMILTVVLFATQASALDFDEWVGFECFQYDYDKEKYITDIPDPDFFAVNKNNKEIYWDHWPQEDPFFNNCKDIDFSLSCKNSKGDYINLHRFTNRLAHNTIDLMNFRTYKCNLVERKF